MAGASGCLGSKWEGGGTHTHTHTHQQQAFGRRDASEQVGSNGMREENAYLTPSGGSSCTRGGFASICVPAPHGTEPLTRLLTESGSFRLFWRKQFVGLVNECLLIDTRARLYLQITDT